MKKLRNAEGVNDALEAIDLEFSDIRSRGMED
jgi:hypothetical protein